MNEEMERRDGPPYRTEETARLLNESDAVIRRAAQQGQLGAFRVGRRWLFPRRLIDKLRCGDEDASMRGGAHGRGPPKRKSAPARALDLDPTLASLTAGQKIKPSRRDAQARAIRAARAWLDPARAR